jgi:hypothetical protein
MVEHDGLYHSSRLMAQAKSRPSKNSATCRKAGAEVDGVHGVVGRVTSLGQRVDSRLLHVLHAAEGVEHDPVRVGLVEVRSAYALAQQGSERDHM